ncbi:MAG: hypothetical protein GX444_01975 [Myxococcales bacterium]|nr:hypothetical protein [Myxococcales bacterium]
MKHFFAVCLSLLCWLTVAAAQEPAVWRDDGDPRSLLLALDRQEKYLNHLPQTSLKLGERRVTKAHALATVRELRRLVLAKFGQPDFGAELARRFEIVVVSRQALFTAYHSPVLRVSERRTDAYPVPILGLPRDLTTSQGKVYRRVGERLVPAPTRAQIMDGAYDAAQLAVAWTNDPVDYYYTQIQGGAVLVYPDGRRRSLLFAGHNGYNYVSMEASALREIPEAERPGGYLGLRDYFRRRPAAADHYFRLNPRFIFFRVGDEPPAGMARLPLTPKRSIATDKRYYSAGLMALISFPEPARQPDGTPEQRPVQYLVADADTGAAITGPDRVDFYFGEGSATELFATGLKNQGTLAYVLLRQQ